MQKRIIISGGGTGGHIFPAVSIAGELNRREPDTELLFVGAKGGMELSVVPRYGYKIEAVWISGIHRQITLRNILRNLLFPIKLASSLLSAGRIVKGFQPHCVVGVGGYASGPVGRSAANKGVPLFLCEQNAYPGLVNKWLAPKAKRILLGNADAGKFFPMEKVQVTGNPIRAFEMPDRETAAIKMGLDPKRPIVLSLGGSLGALTLNEALKKDASRLVDQGIQLVWQCGKRYYDGLRPQLQKHPDLHLMAFIEDMAAAYAASDLVISRAGGSTISELIALSKPAILVPSPNVAEDHQTKNALSLSELGAAELVRDADAREQLVNETIAIVQNPKRLEALTAAISKTEKHDAAKEIVDAIYAEMKWT